jgi:hypothetical protein
MQGVFLAFFALAKGLPLLWNVHLKKRQQTIRYKQKMGFLLEYNLEIGQNRFNLKHSLF